MVPTLFGITLVTFGLVHLAPGDPVAAQIAAGGVRGGISPELIEEYRRTHFLDLPLFVNPKPSDLPVDLARILRKASDPSKRPWIVRRLARRGSAAVPHLVEMLSTDSAPRRAVVLEALSRIAEPLGVVDELRDTDDPVRFWRSYWRVHRIDFRRPNADRLAKRWVRSGSPATREQLERLGTYALPALVDLLGEDLSDAGLARLTSVLATITDYRTVFRVEEDESRRDDAIATWEEWWFKHRAEYVAFDGFDSAVAVIGETQYVKWMRRIATLSFGLSLRDRRPIADKLREKIPVTLLLSVSALFVSYLFAIPLGILAAVRHGRAADRGIGAVLFVLYSVPPFWLAMMLIMSQRTLRWFPIRGLLSEGWERMSLGGRVGDVAWHLVLPVVCLSVTSFAWLSRFQRVAMLDVIRQDYVRTARAKGLPEWSVVLRHALRNALLPIVTLLGLQLPHLLAGSVIVESIFNIPGMGQETFEAISMRDYNWVMAVAVLAAVLTMLGVLLSDLVYAIVDPRISLARKGPAE